MTDETQVTNGDAVYDDDGTELGVVTDATTDGFTVAAGEGVEYAEPAADTGGSDADDPSGPAADTEELDVRESDPGEGFGEGYIMWRCADCGEMGELDDGLPEECPECGADAVEKWRED